MFILVPIAFISGILTVFSPCVLPILPVVLASGFDGDTLRIKGLIAGLVITFTAASLLLATIVKVLGVPADMVRSIAVILLAIFGLSLVFPVIWSKGQYFIEKFWHLEPMRSQNSGFGGGFLTGVSLGIVWTPCIGPVLAAVATLAAISSFSPTLVLVAFAYAAGTGIPLYFLAKGASAASQKLTFFKANDQKIRQVFGVVILVTAFFIWTGADKALQAWTLAHLPSSWTQLPTIFENSINVNKSIQQLNKSSEVKKRVSLQTDFNGAKVKPEDLVQGCLGHDCIPSVNQPRFEMGQKISWLKDDDVVFAMNYKGVERAYPQRIVNWHEIVNDTIASEPIVVTFCPLCGSAVAFERKVNGVVSEFGVSGKLHDSDLVMYDRLEGNLWQQITGEALVGPAARRNEKLSYVPIATTTWRKWQTTHPNSEVLSRDTGFIRNYDQYPYGTYERDDQLLFGVKNLNKSLPIKTVVYGIELDGQSKAYQESELKKRQVIEDKIGDVLIRLERKDSGEIEALNLKTNEKIIPIRLFWFAWAAFHPETEVYK